MANLSENDRNIIAEHPLGNYLGHLQDLLRKAEQNNEPGSLSHDENIGSHDQGTKMAISRLLSALQGHEVAFDLRSKTESSNVATELSKLFGLVQSDRYNYEHYRTLSRLVIKQAPDVDIWDAVFDLIIIVSRTTPPQSLQPFASTFQQIPWGFNTSNFADISEHRSKVDDALREELFLTLRIDIPDFIPAVFGHIPRLDELAETVFDQCQEGDNRLYTDGSGWTKWPKNAKEDLVLEWLQELVKRFIVWVNEHGVHPATPRQIYKGPNTYLDGSPIKRKMDVGFMTCHGHSEADYGMTHKPKSDWAQMLVTGELKSNSNQNGRQQAWLDLATYAREVFRSQDRRFVLGFTLCGSMMRLWHFDRSGSSGSSSFDINQDGSKFVHVILGYLLMNDEQYGVDPTIRQSDGQRYVEITRDDQIERLILTEEIRKHAVIAGRATACWRAYCDKDQSKEPLVVKMSWQYRERPEEGELIKEATDKGVRHIARYYHHETVQVDGKDDDTIENVRKGLMKTCGRTTFREKSFIDSEAPASQSSEPALVRQTQSQSSSRKRLSSLTEMAPPPAKRSSSRLGPINPKKTLHNRVHRHVITRDPGRPIYETSSPVALVKGFIGAVSGKYAGIRINDISLTYLGHESLLSAGILHRDVSIGNILLTEKEDDGFLIDLDLAIKTSDDQASSAPSKTGTKIFMAIGALYGEPHSFMHDLESFFWVLFWICIHCDGLDEKGKVKRRRVPQYEKWNYADTGELAITKKGLIGDERDFHDVTAGFTPTFQSLAPYVRDLRQYVFPNGRRSLGENKELYSQMRTVFEKAKGDLSS